MIWVKLKDYKKIDHNESLPQPGGFLIFNI